MAFLTHKGKYFYSVSYVNGKYKWTRLGKHDRVADAKIRYEDHLKNKNATDQDGIFNDVALKYLDYCKTIKSAKTHSLEKGIFKLANKSLGSLLLIDISAEVVADFIASIKVKPNTLRIYLTFISNVLKYARARGYRCADPFASIKIPHPKVHEYETRAVPMETINAVIHNLPPVHRQIACIMKYTICRPFEVFGLKPEDVDVENLILRISSPKNNNRKRARIIPIDERLLPMLKDLPIKTSERAFFLALRKACIKAGVDPKKLTPYVFRHSSATKYLELTNDLSGLANLMGHSTLEMTNRYSRTLEAKLRKNVSVIY